MSDLEQQWNAGILANGAQEYPELCRLKLLSTQFATENPTWDHEHCDLCWTKISGYPGDLHAGYATADRHHWICPDCVRNFRDVFHWSIADDACPPAPG